ncbi:MAG: T9SS type A sorting domain-containing protein [Taibaiella sp.]|nr:T9SS type A sorting domain-containing protein [Taibaiella sp.]
MRNRLVLVLIITLWVMPCKGQNYFNERNTVHSLFSKFSSVVQLNGKYYCVGTCVDSLRFVVFDQFGNIEVDTNYLTPNKSINIWGNNLNITKDSCLVLAVTEPDTGYINMAVIMKFDRKGHLLLEREYEVPFCASLYQVFDLKPTGTGEWLMLANQECRTAISNNYAVTKLDSNFNVIWNKQLIITPANDVPSRILVENNGYLFAGTNVDGSYLGPTYTYRAALIKTDTAGNVLWNWRRDTTRQINAIQDVIKTKDSGYVYCSTICYEHSLDISGHSPQHWKGWIEKLDRNRNVVWSDSIGFYYGDHSLTNQTALKELNNGDIVVAGAVDGGLDSNTTTLPNYSNYATLICYSANGIRKWSRHYQLPNDSLYYSVYDMKQTTDKGYVLVGDALGNKKPYYQSWIIKVDSNGCSSPTDPQCRPLSTKNWQLAYAYINVYPNPAHDIVNVRTMELQNAEVIITDMAGRICIQQAFSNDKNMQSIRITSLPSGMYFYKIMQVGIAIGIGKFVKQ